MLYFQTIEQGTLSILKQLLKNELLEQFYLAGGTALALQLGHRKSFDLDFFGNTSLTSNEIAKLLGTYENAREITRSENIISWTLTGVKVDFVNYQYPIIEKPVYEEGLRMLSVKDIAAMKLDAIKGRGRKRDFYDLFFLLRQFTLKDLLHFHQQKYNHNSNFLVLKSLSYFRDADGDPKVRTMDTDPGWASVKDTIAKAIVELS